VKRKNLLSLALALLTAIALSIAFAAVFSYYPVSIAISPVSPPVYFATGSNANTNDLGADNTIAVSVGSSNTNVSITIHPTYQVTYYKNVTLIVNSDSKAYNISLRVVTAASLSSGARAVVYVYNKNATRSLSGYPPTLEPSGYVKNVSLTSTGTTYIGSLSGGSVYEIDIYVYIPEGTRLPSSTTASLLLIASPSSESPP
jgi:hypothetical protein